MSTTNLPARLTYEADLFPCPACGEQIRARITAGVNPATVETEHDDETVTVTVTVPATLQRYDVHHNCSGRVTVGEASDDPGDRP